MQYASEKMILAIFLMAAVTYLPRFLPLFFLSRRKLAPLVEIWLSYVPVAVLASLLGPTLLIAEGKLTFQISENIYFWAALPSIIVALYTKNMFLTVLAGMGSAALLRLLI